MIWLQKSCLIEPNNTQGPLLRLTEVLWKQAEFLCLTETLNLNILGGILSLSLPIKCTVFLCSRKNNGYYKSPSSPVIAGCQQTWQWSPRKVSLWNAQSCKRSRIYRGHGLYHKEERPSEIPINSLKTRARYENTKFPLVNLYIQY